jgi:hypothetical protein
MADRSPREEEDSPKKCENWAIITSAAFFPGFNSMAEAQSALDGRPDYYGPSQIRRMSDLKVH